MVNRYDLYLKVCPFCGHHHLIRWGYYLRKVLPLPGVIRIQRVRCMSCGHTTNVLPSFLLAYRSYQVNELKELVSLLIKHPYNWKMFPAITIDLSTAYRWLRRFKRQALGALPVLRKELLNLSPQSPVMESFDALPEPLLTTNIIFKRFLSLAEELFRTALCLVEENNPKNEDVFCFLNYFLARHTTKALLVF